MFFINILGVTSGTSGSSDDKDKDLSIRPGDVVFVPSGYDDSANKEEYVVVSEGGSLKKEQFKVDIECVEHYPDEDLTGSATCNGFNPEVGGNPLALDYMSWFEADDNGHYARTHKEDGKIGVAVLVDQSGSMKGFVDKVSKKEIAHDLTLYNAVGFREDGSDVVAQRVSVIETFLESLNTTDKAVVFKFSSEVGTRPKVVCWNPDELGEEELRATCYSKDKDMIVAAHPDFGQNTAALHELQTESRGRTPLWAAVADVRDFMTKVTETEVRHIVVIGDGPDTCHADSPDYQPFIRVEDEDSGEVSYEYQPPCSDTGYAYVKAIIEGDIADYLDDDIPDEQKPPLVHIHFVQFQAPGYLERDPRQQELACITGGHYVFVNSEDLPKDNSTALQDSLQDAIMRVRYTLAGAWAMAVDMVGLGQSPLLLSGAEIAIQGSLTLIKTDGGITRQDQTIELDIGKKTGSEGLNNYDLRAAIRLACGSTGDCDWLDGDSGECVTAACVDHDLVCGLIPDSEGLDCTAGEGGVCCSGDCLEGMTACTPVEN